MHRSAQQELGYQLLVLREQLAQLNLKHERYKQAAAQGDADGAEVESLLAKMERRTKVRDCKVSVRVRVVVSARVEVEVESLLAKMDLRTKARSAPPYLDFRMRIQ